VLPSVLRVIILNSAKIFIVLCMFLSTFWSHNKSILQVFGVGSWAEWYNTRDAHYCNNARVVSYCCWAQYCPVSVTASEPRQYRSSDLFFCCYKSYLFIYLVLITDGSHFTVLFISQTRYSFHKLLMVVNGFFCVDMQLRTCAVIGFLFSY